MRDERADLAGRSDPAGAGAVRAPYDDETIERWIGEVKLIVEG